MKQKIRELFEWAENNKVAAKIHYAFCYCVVLIVLWGIIFSFIHNKSVAGFLCIIGFFAARYVLNALIYHIDSGTEAYYKREEEDFDKPFDDVRPRNDRIRCVADYELDSDTTYWTTFNF